MTKGLQRSLSRAPISRQAGAVKSHRIAITAGSFSVDGSATVGFGTYVAGQLPEGNIVIQSAMAYLQFSGSGSDAELSDVWEGDFGVGTTPASDGTLSAADVDIVASTALAAATAEVGVRTRGVGAAQSIVDNTASTLEVNVNLLIDDAHVGPTSSTITVTGEIEILYSVVMDD